MVLLAIAGFCLVLLGYVAGNVTGGMGDRVLAILVLGIFVVFFWAAFEQAGNVLNVWADQTTDRFITQEAEPPKVIPDVPKEKAKEDGALAHVGFVQHFLNLFPNMVTLKNQPVLWNPEKLGAKVWSAGSTRCQPPGFNPSMRGDLWIAPIFAWLWIYLDRKGWQPSIPMKMTLGLLMMSGSMAVMLAAAKDENRHTEFPWNNALPDGISETATHQLAHGKAENLEVFHAGRLTKEGQTLSIYGVLDKNECDLLIEKVPRKVTRKKSRS